MLHDNVYLQGASSREYGPVGVTLSHCDLSVLQNVANAAGYSSECPDYSVPHFSSSIRVWGPFMVHLCQLWKNLVVIASA